MGYHASWPLFAFSHHIIVWFAAEQVYPGERFTRYAILGDDIVIADSAVAARYSSILDRLGVDISIGKSLFSDRGVCEFAKRFRVRNELDRENGTM